MRTLAAVTAAVMVMWTGGVGAQSPDLAGAEACSEFIRGVGVFLDGGSLSSLRSTYRRVAGHASGSPDAYVRNAGDILVRAMTMDEMVSAATVFSGVCKTRAFQQNIRVWGPTEPANAPPAPAGTPGSGPGLSASTHRAGDAVRRLTERFKELSGAIRETNTLRGIPTPSPPGTEGAPSLGDAPTAIPADEAERRSKAALERSGELGATCTKKQYGTGWVTICE